MGDAIRPGEAATAGLRTADLPELYRSASGRARTEQRRSTQLIGAELVLLALAALSGVEDLNGRADWLKVAGAACFVSAAILKAQLLASRPAERWYQSRAVAEGVKSLAWRFAVGGVPFPVSDPTSGHRYLERVHELATSYGDLTLTPDVDRPDQITPSMESLREQSLARRMDAYVDGRVRDQQRWYANKAREVETNAKRWSTFTLVLQLAAGLHAVLNATGVLRLGLLGLGAALAGTAEAWGHSRHRAGLATAYSVASRDLGKAAAFRGEVTDEAGWAAYVDRAEHVMSREHATWHASHR